MNDMRIGFIGAGKVGITLGSYFISKGLCVSGYSSNNVKSASLAAEITSTQAFSNIRELVGICNMIFITTSDDEVIKVWNDLKKCKIGGMIICHTSGSLSSEIFSDIGDFGAYGYSIHPMHAFSDKNGRITGLDSAYFTIEGDCRRIDVAADMIRALGNKVLIIDASKKTIYHLAGVMVSNLVLSLISMGDECMQQSGVSSESSMDALMPLIISNIDNISKRGFEHSLTGPVDRNDTGTVIRHLEVIPHQFGRIYAELSARLVGLAQMRHPERDYRIMHEQLDRYLNDYDADGEGSN